jgi:methyl-accepting chemotaxis protein
VSEVRRTRDEIVEQRDAVEQAARALDRIAEHAKQTNLGVQEISSASQEQAASTREVVSIVDHAASISEETTTESETVAAAAEQQTTALTEVTTTAEGLSGKATRLSRTLDRFETGADADQSSKHDGFTIPADEASTTR